MDKFILEFRFSNWKEVIKQCSLKPVGQIVKNSSLIMGLTRKPINTDIYK